jgi:Ca2+-binding RTX toxin-like protein
MAVKYGGSGNGNDTIIGTKENDLLYGLGGNDYLEGLEGNDLLDGGDGYDTLDGGAGKDTMVGGNNSDTYIVDSNTDTIIETEGGGSNDLVKSSVSYTLGNWLNDLTLTGNNPINGTGNSLDNTITGNDADNILKGGAGNDSIKGDDGDSLFGEAGNDTLTNNTSFEPDRRAYMDGGDGNDVLDGDFARMHGGNGDDTINGGTSSIIYGENGNDRLDGNESDIYGGAGNDSLSGDYSYLYGGYGDDILRTVFSASMEGGYGNDTLIGSSGDSNSQDYFVFNTPDEGIDTIRNFEPNGDSDYRDLIVVSASGFGGGLAATIDMPMQAITADQFVLGTAAVDVNDRFIYNIANGVLSFDVDGTGALEQVHFATLDGAPRITNNNIVVA